MVNMLIEAICDKLTALFEDTVVYTEKVPQNFTTPSFYIRCINYSDDILLFDNRRKIAVFDITYFPAENSLTAQEEMNSVAVKLRENMHFINVGDNILKSYDTDINKDNSNDCEELHFIVSYKYILFKEKDDVKMEVLKERNDVNGK